MSSPHLTSSANSNLKTEGQPALRLQDIRFRYGKTEVLDGVDLLVEPGKVLGLVGPNGSGKTTALRCCFRAISPSAGRITCYGDDIEHLERRELARRIGVSGQHMPGENGLVVRDSVLLGRAPHRHWLQAPRETDHAIVAQAIDEVGLSEFSERDVSDLSGGERQRVGLARAFAQETDILLLDEPTNHLDLYHQLTILDLVTDKARQGAAVVITMHDLRLAVEYCDVIAVLQRGRVAAVGKPQDVLTPHLLESVFGVIGEVTIENGKARVLIDRRSPREQDRI